MPRNIVISLSTVDWFGWLPSTNHSGWPLKDGGNVWYRTYKWGPVHIQMNNEKD